MHPAEVIATLRQWWAWVGTLHAAAQPGLVLALAFGVPWVLRTYLAEQWEAATIWATAKVRPFLGAKLTAAFRKAIQGVPSLCVGAAVGVLLHGGDVGAILSEQFYVVFAPLLHELAKKYQGGNYPAAGELKPTKEPAKIGVHYSGDDAPSDPPPPRNIGTAALLVLAAGLALSQTCCTGSLVLAQHDALRAKYGSTPGDVGYAPSERCHTLSDRHTTWGGIGKGSAIVALVAGPSVLPADELPERVRGPAKYTAAGVAAGAAALAAAAIYVEQDSAAAFTRECQP